MYPHTTVYCLCVRQSATRPLLQSFRRHVQSFHVATMRVHLYGLHGFLPLDLHGCIEVSLVLLLRSQACRPVRHLQRPEMTPPPKQRISADHHSLNLKNAWSHLTSVKVSHSTRLGT